jgi:predicted P-loop ATPase
MDRMQNGGRSSSSARRRPKRYRAGEHWWPDTAFEREHIKPQQDARFDADAWEEAIGNFAKGKDRVTVSQVAVSALGIEIGKLDKRTEMRIASILGGRLLWTIGPGRPRH